MSPAIVRKYTLMASLPSVSTPENAERRAPSLWRNRDYLLLMSGQALSETGGAVSDLAFPLLILAITHSAAQAGFAAALGAAPPLFLTLFAGALVDRLNRKHVMLVCDAGRMLTLGSIVVAFALGHLTIWQLYAAALLEGALGVTFELARSAAIPQVTGPEQLDAAFAQEEFIEGATTLLGPSLSGALYAIGPIVPFLTDTLSYLVSVVTLGLIRTPFQQERAGESRRIWAEIGEGARWLWRQPFVLSMTLMMGAGAFVYGAETIYIIILAQRLGASALTIGVIFATGGVGSLVGVWITDRLRGRLSVGHAIIISRWWWALSLPLLALAPSVLALGALNFGLGFFDPFEDIPYFSHRMKLIPEELRGRVISVCRLVPGVMRPLGLALIGILIQRVGVISTIWMASAWVITATVIVTAVPYVRRERDTATMP